MERLQTGTCFSGCHATLNIPLIFPCVFLKANWTKEDRWATTQAKTAAAHAGCCTTAETSFPHLGGCASSATRWFGSVKLCNVALSPFQKKLAQNKEVKSRKVKWLLTVGRCGRGGATTRLLPWTLGSGEQKTC